MASASLLGVGGKRRKPREVCAVFKFGEQPLIENFEVAQDLDVSRLRRIQSEPAGPNSGEVQEAVPVDTGKLVENPERLEVPRWGFIERLQSLDDCACFRGHRRELLSSCGGKQVGPASAEPVPINVANNRKARLLNLAVGQRLAPRPRSFLREGVGEVFQRGARVLKNVANQDRQRRFVWRPKDPSRDDVVRWLRVRLDVDRTAIQMNPPVDLGFQFLEVLTRPREL